MTLSKPHLQSQRSKPLHGMLGLLLGVALVAVCPTGPALAAHAGSMDGRPGGIAHAVSMDERPGGIAHAVDAPAGKQAEEGEQPGAGDSGGADAERQASPAQAEDARGQDAQEKASDDSSDAADAGGAKASPDAADDAKASPGDGEEPRKPDADDAAGTGNDKEAESEPASKDQLPATEGDAAVMMLVNDGSPSYFRPCADAGCLDDVTFRICTKLPDDLESYESFHWRIDAVLAAGLELQHGDLSSARVLADGVELEGFPGDKAKLKLEDGKLSLDCGDVLDALGREDAARHSRLALEFHAHLTPDAPEGPATCTASYTHTKGKDDAGDVLEDIDAKCRLYSLGAHFTVEPQSLPQAGDYPLYTLQAAPMHPNLESRGLYVQADGDLAETPFTFTPDDAGLLSFEHLDAGAYTLRQVTTQEDAGEPSATFIISPVYDEDAGSMADLDISFLQGDDPEALALQGTPTACDDTMGVASADITLKAAPVSITMGAWRLSVAELACIIALAIACATACIVLARGSKARKQAADVPIPTAGGNDIGKPQWQYW